MNDKTLGKVRNWTNDDGSIATTYYVRNAMKRKGEKNPETGEYCKADETEEEFIARVDRKLRKAPEFKDRHSTLDEAKDMPDMKEKRRFRRRKDGKIFIDPKVETPEEKMEKEVKRINKKKDKARKKLKDLGLTDDEISVLIP